MRGGRKRESESERWRAVGVHKSEKQAGEWSVAGSVVVAAAVGRPPARALARVPQRRVGVAVVMMRGMRPRGKGLFGAAFCGGCGCGAALPAAHWLAGSLPTSSPWLGCAVSLPPARQRLRG